MAEVFNNDASTILSAAITAGATSLVVTSAAQFNTSGTFRIRIDDEIMTVTGVVGLTWTVTRASEVCEGVQTAAAHAAGSGVYGVLTAGSLSTIASSSGTVTSVAVATASGVSGSVTNPSGAATITITLGAITPSSVAAAGTVTGSNLSGTNTGDQDLSGLVPKTTTVNGHALSSNVTVTAADVGAPSGSGSSTGTNTGDVTVSSPLTLAGQLVGLGVVPASLGGLGLDTSVFTSGQIPIAQGAGSYLAAGRSGFFAGHGAPAAGLGYPTDYYVDLDSGTVYLKS